ncbi:type I restriction endonuclease subunit R [Maritalea mediterranea]|uniref:Type I restriction enzyme endonuclease subunit n=1 Tax=Maritalea mediterranea TaxID=2909667 RepID=A0ABS9EC50_9HYPH|nr:type I restriction endonuclease subunit R [Maritalea mediterranea]MCF4099772.1 type I restriction endonuclease subunit R [Maritalea mediterranea]
MSEPTDILYEQLTPDYGDGFSEDALVQKPAVELFADLGWTTLNLQREFEDDTLMQGRSLHREKSETQGWYPREWWLPGRQRSALTKLNPELTQDALDHAYRAITRPRLGLAPYAANRDVMMLLRDGIPVPTRNARGESETKTARVIDWRNIEENDFLLAEEVWFGSETHSRRADLVGFVNGIPLLFIELKGMNVNVQHAHSGNLKDYKDAIPHVFNGNGFVLLSNGTDTRIGAFDAPWRHFRQWKRLSEDEPGQVSLERAIRAACTPAALLDMVENFTVFQDEKSGLIKKVAQNHQMIGVNRAIANLENRQDNGGKIGVFWHTQGSGKSLSMVFFARKALRKMRGGLSFIVVTDRTELDDQIAQTFAECGLLEKRTESVQAQTRKHLRELLEGNERFMFTLIQKFASDDQLEPLGVLSERDDIVVIVDEAHRSQYATFAANMRSALPNANFIGFTGTPLMAGEQKTREVFGDYVSVYDFAQSVKDGATVPLYYENRIPELQLKVDDLDQKLGELLDDVDLDEEQEKALERRMGRRYHILTRDDRLDKIAADVVKHFPARGFRGKGMFVALDKATAVRMYEKVQHHWALEIKRLEALKEPSEGDLDKLKFMRETDMAVMVSQSQNEIADLEKYDIDIRPYRKRILDENLDDRFKADEDPLRLIFVCAMWITGFDVPTCSTIYLDKPMRNHTLMQTIARANRTAEGKSAGLIVDYVGIFRKLQEALEVYVTPEIGDKTPIEDIGELINNLTNALDEAEKFASSHHADLAAIQKTRGFDRQAAINKARDALNLNDDVAKTFLAHEKHVWGLFTSALPDPRAQAEQARVMVLRFLSKCLKADRGQVDISDIELAIQSMLDDVIESVQITTAIRENDDETGRVDLSKLDINKLRTDKKDEAVQTRAQKLRTAVGAQVAAMASRNPIRSTLVARFEALVAEYNTGNMEAEEFVNRLLEFLSTLDDEERRHVREGLAEEELAIFDLLTNPGPELSDDERELVKKVASDVLHKVKSEVEALDWQLREKARAAVRAKIREALDLLPAAYEETIWNRKVERTYDWIMQSADNIDMQ